MPPAPGVSYFGHRRRSPDVLTRVSHVEAEVERSCPRHVLAGAVVGTAVFLAGCPASPPQDRAPASAAPQNGTAAPVAPKAGVTGTWSLLNPADVSPFARTLRIGVMRMDCSGGKTGTVLAPRVQIEPERIVIRADVARLPPGAYTCPGNDAVPVTVELRGPIGNRKLVDAACLEDRAARTAYCLDGGVRWPCQEDPGLPRHTNRACRPWPVASGS